MEIFLLVFRTFFFTEKVRGKGVGKLLFDEVLSIAKQKKVGRFEWQVLDWNEPALNFYRKYDSILDKNWINGKITFN
jgi:GNAT superfamily N-acetyltransferase